MSQVFFFFTFLKNKAFKVAHFIKVPLSLIPCVGRTDNLNCHEAGRQNKSGERSLAYHKAD